MIAMIPPTIDEHANQSRRFVRWSAGVLVALVILTVVAFLGTNAVVKQRIRQINDHGGVVMSWAPTVADPLFRPFGYRVRNWVEDAYVIRSQYDVYFGNSESSVGCTSGVTLWVDTENESDAGDVGPALAKELGSIVRLSFAETTVSDAGLAHLRGMNSLAMLNLDKTIIRGPGLVHLQDLSIQILSLRGTLIDDRFLEYLPDLPELQFLDLGETKITGSTLRLLKRYPKLAALDLDGTKINDDTIREISTLPLESLNLYDTAITEKAIEYLEKMPSLNYAHLCRTGIGTDAALRSTNDAVKRWVELNKVLCNHDAPPRRTRGSH